MHFLQVLHFYCNYCIFYCNYFIFYCNYGIFYCKYWIFIAIIAFFCKKVNNVAPFWICVYIDLASAGVVDLGVVFSLRLKTKVESLSYPSEKKNYFIFIVIIAFLLQLLHLYCKKVNNVAPLRALWRWNFWGVEYVWKNK